MQSPDKILVNFRAFPNLVETFDNVCFLSGKTRTQVLTEMMKQRIATEGRKVALKIEKDAALNERLKTAVERQTATEVAEQPREWSSAVRNRLKPFSSFDLPVR
jgi:broad specificity phosphatase PhoE